jgi:hypothetical protein
MTAPLKKKRFKKHGFTLVSTIFIVVLLALVTGFIVNISTLTRSSATLTRLGLQTYFAAKSGLEWAQFAITTAGSPYNCPSSPTTLQFNQGALTGFSVTISCTQNAFTEHDTTYNVFRITSVGSYTSASGLENTRRQIEARIVQPGL